VTKGGGRTRLPASLQAGLLAARAAARAALLPERPGAAPLRPPALPPDALTQQRPWPHPPPPHSHHSGHQAAQGRVRARGAAAVPGALRLPAHRPREGHHRGGAQHQVARGAGWAAGLAAWQPGSLAAWQPGSLAAWLHCWREQRSRHWSAAAAPGVLGNGARLACCQASMRGQVHAPGLLPLSRCGCDAPRRRRAVGPRPVRHLPHRVRRARLAELRARPAQLHRQRGRLRHRVLPAAGAPPPPLPPSPLPRASSPSCHEASRPRPAAAHCPLK
jgi:hypothetical protein